MLRYLILSLTLSGVLSACTDGSVGYPTPPQQGMDPVFSDSIGFTGVGQEPY